MAKKIVSLLGSPRVKGNSATVAKHFQETAEKLGANVTSYVLNKLEYRGCQACMTCKKKLDRCVLKDDLAEVLDAVRDADVLLIATPVYYGEVSSQVKAFIDRTYSYLVPDYVSNPKPCRLPPGKKLVFIQSQGQPDEALYADIFPRYESFFKWYGFDATYLIRACGVSEPGEVANQEKVMKQAEEIAKQVMA